MSIGLAPTKVLAKIGSKWNKPSGYTYIPGNKITEYLAKLDVKDVWGIGNNTAEYMYQLGIKTALDFISRDEAYIKQYFTKPHQELWYELKGEMRYEVSSQEKTSYASISKTKTFTPASNDPTFIHSQLVKNLENACIKARRYNLVAKKIVIFLKTQNFETQALEACITRASAYPTDITKIVRQLFDSVYMPNVQYRATGVALCDLQEDTAIQASLFEAPVELVQVQQLFTAVDTVAKKFGKHALHLGASLHANVNMQHAGDRGVVAVRKQKLFKGETARRRIGLPMLFHSNV